MYRYYKYYIYFNISLLNHCTQAARWSTLVIKVVVMFVGVCISRCLKQVLA